MRSLGDIVGKYVVRDLPAGTLVIEPYFAPTPVKLPEPPKADPSPIPPTPRPEHVVRIIGQFTITSSQFFFFTWFPTYLSEYRHLSVLKTENKSLNDRIQQLNVRVWL